MKLLRSLRSSAISAARTLRAMLAPALLAVSASGCASCGESAICSMKGTINQPENRSMRRDLLKTGLASFCQEMLARSAPLKLQNDQPTIGRFYPRTCTQREQENGDLYVAFEGNGYGWTGYSRKLAFTMAGRVTYNQDFLVAEGGGCDIYGYFRPRHVEGSDFKLTLIQNQLARQLNQAMGAGQTFGSQMVSSKLNQGFTVIRHSEGGDEFSLGVVELGQRPFHPFQVHGEGKIVMENERLELHQNQRDFAPVTISESGRSLYLQLQTDGGVPVDVFVFGKAEGEANLRDFLDKPDVAPFSMPPYFADVVQPGPTPYRHAIPLPPGQYYVVIDNSNQAGSVAPAQGVLDDRAVLVDSLIQVGDN